MFKKAKRCNFRRRNDSDDEEKEDVQQSGGPGAEESANPSESITGPAPGANILNNHGNGFQPGSVKINKDKKKRKENREEPKASLLSFHDDEGAYQRPLKTHVT